MTSNCYVVYDEDTKRCLVIDPASEKSVREIEFIDNNSLQLDYVILTHEHTDHTWGVNALIDRYLSAKVICSEECEKALAKETKKYFQLYYDNSNYEYNVRRVDYTTEKLGKRIGWNEHIISFVTTSGHTPGSICVVIDDILFGGDTLMPYKPLIKKRNGGSIDDFRKSLIIIEKLFCPDTLVYPGHGECMILEDIFQIYRQLSLIDSL